MSKRYICIKSTDFQGEKKKVNLGMVSHMWYSESNWGKALYTFRKNSKILLKILKYKNILITTDWFGYIENKHSSKNKIKLIKTKFNYDLFKIKKIIIITIETSLYVKSIVYWWSFKILFFNSN